MELESETTHANPLRKSADFPAVFKEERERIRRWRKNRGMPEEDELGHLDLIGVAFSGGGIRSATFNLGVLQAMAHSRILHCVDYLSTV
jgi:predicted acylesterase/phospholipase RssA